MFYICNCCRVIVSLYSLERFFKLQCEINFINSYIQYMHVSSWFCKRLSLSLEIDDIVKSRWSFAAEIVIKYWLEHIRQVHNTQRLFWWKHWRTYPTAVHQEERTLLLLPCLNRNLIGQWLFFNVACFSLI